MSRSPNHQNRHLRVVSRTEPPKAEERGDADVLAAWDSNSGEFGRLFHDHVSSTVEGTLVRVLGGRSADHDDLVQVTYERIFVSLARGQFRRDCSLRAWAGILASRVALNEIRRRSSERRVLLFGKSEEAEERPRSESGPSERAVARQTLDIVRRELAVIPKRQSETVLLHDVLGHELTEIATLLDISVAAAQSRLVRGRKELHRRLAKRGLIKDTKQ